MEALYYFNNCVLQHANHPQIYKLHLNKTAVDMALERYHDVTKGCNTALILLGKSIEGENTAILSGWEETALIRKAFALYRMERWQAAQKVYSLCLKMHPRSDQSKRGIEKCLKRQSEARDGTYDWKSLHESVTSKTSITLVDAADYLGPVYLGRTPEMGRGLLASRDITAGELILANKSILTVTDTHQGHRYSQYGYAERGLHHALARLPKRTSKPAVDVPVFAHFKRGLTYQAYHQPEMARYMDKMYAGETYPSIYTSEILTISDIDEEQRLPVDFGRIRRVAFFNTTCYPLPAPNEAEDIGRLAGKA